MAFVGHWSFRLVLTLSNASAIVVPERPFEARMDKLKPTTAANNKPADVRFHMFLSI
jgi:hypothetical protein